MFGDPLGGSFFGRLLPYRHRAIERLPPSRIRGCLSALRRWADALASSEYALAGAGFKPRSLSDHPKFINPPRVRRANQTRPGCPGGNRNMKQDCIQSPSMALHATSRWLFRLQPRDIMPYSGCIPAQSQKIGKKPRSELQQSPLPQRRRMSTHSLEHC
jgi:hypothetical protein